jgi:hypothetical protein
MRNWQSPRQANFWFARHPLGAELSYIPRTPFARRAKVNTRRLNWPIVMPARIRVWLGVVFHKSPRASSGITTRGKRETRDFPLQLDIHIAVLGGVADGAALNWRISFLP